MLARLVSLASGRLHAGRCIPQRNGGGVNGGPPHLLWRALLSQRAREATRDLLLPGASSDRGSSWHQCVS